MYAFLGSKVNTDNHLGKVTLNQGGLTKKLLNTVEILDSNKKISPSSTRALGTDDYGTTFDEPWEYTSFVGILMCLSGRSRPDINFTVHQCARFTQNPRRSHD